MHELYTIFTYDYGIIKVTKKGSQTKQHKRTKGKILDIGHMINFEISTKNNSEIHQMKCVYILSEFEHTKKKFADIQAYLILLNILLKKIPKGVPNYEIFEMTEIMNKTDHMTETHYILVGLKVIDIVGELYIEDQNTTIRKILHFIHSNKFGNIRKLVGITKEIQERLKQILMKHMSQ